MTVLIELAATILRPLNWERCLIVFIERVLFYSGYVLVECWVVMSMCLRKTNDW